MEKPIDFLKKNPDYDVSKIIFNTVVNSEKVAVYILQNFDIDINKKFNSLYKDSILHLAYSWNREKVVKILIDNPKTDINILDENNESLIFIAINTKRTEIVQMMLENDKIDLNIQNKYGETPSAEQNGFAVAYCL